MLYNNIRSMFTRNIKFVGQTADTQNEKIFSKSKIFNSILASGLIGGGWYLTTLGKEMSVMRNDMRHLEEKMNDDINRLEQKIDTNMGEINNNMREIRQYIFELKNEHNN
jgi:hypothetical protein